MTRYECKAISNLRVMSMIFIFICHVIAYSKYYLIATTNQFFDVGVYIFLMISGFIYGGKDIVGKYSFFKWMYYRYKRITIPVVVSALFMVIVNLNTQHPVTWQQILTHVLNLEVFFPSINGLHHLWFVSIIMFCYLLLYVLDLSSHLRVKKIMCLIFAFIANIVVVYVVVKNRNVNIIKYMISISTFLVAYYMKIDNYKDRLANVHTYILLIIIAALIRVGGHICIDDSYLYYVIAGYTHSIMGYSFLCIAISSSKYMIFTKDTFFDSACEFLDNHSYYFYIVHYTFVAGQISLIYLTPLLGINVLLIFAVSLFCSVLLKFICEKIYMIIP